MKKFIVIALMLVLIPTLFAKESALKSIRTLNEPLVLSPEFRSTGGPDSFGYEWIDSDEPWGPAFNWIEISGTGTDMSLSDDDTYWPIPFTFTFYDTTYDSIAVQSNGTISFGNAYIDYENYHIPGPNSSNANSFLALLWTDLDPSDAGAVYYQIMGDTLVVEWDGVPLYGTSEYQKFEALLIGSNGRIIFQYLSNAGSGDNAVVGIQGDSLQPPLWGLEYSYYSAVLHPLLAIEFSTYFYHDVAPASINIDTPLPEGITIAPVATVTNLGTSYRFFDVYCEIEPGGYSSSAVAYVNPGDSIPVAFAPSFTFATGSYTVTVYTDMPGDETPANDTLVKIIETYVPGVEEGNSGIPKELALTIPTICINGKINVELALPATAHVILEVYDALGRPVETLVSDGFSAGAHSIPVSVDLPAGVYFYSLKTDIDETIVKKVLHVR